VLERKPSPGLPLDEAYTAFWNADYHRALALFHKVDAPGCSVMRARALMRLGYYERCLTEYTRRDLSAFDFQEAVGLAGCAAQMFTELAEDNLAVEALNAAERIAIQSSDRALIAYCAQTRCHTALCAGKFEKSRDLLTGAVYLASLLGESRPKRRYHLDFTLLRARVYGLQAWHAALQGDFVAQEEHCLASASSASEPSNRDRYAEAQALNNLGILVSGRPFAAGRQHLISRLKALPSSPHADEAETRMHRSLRNNSRLFRHEKESTDLAPLTGPSLALRFAERVDAMQLGRWRDRKMFLAELRSAVSVAFDIDWSTPGSELLDMLSFAALLAPFDRALARRASALFYARFGDVPRQFVGKHEARDEAPRKFTDACLAKAEGRFDDAVKYFRAAAEIQCLDRNLEAISGIERYPLTKLPADLEAARSFINRFPTSSFSRRLQDALATIEGAAPGDFPYLGMYGIPNSGVGSVGAA
jgi:hypothetical protein